MFKSLFDDGYKELKKDRKIADKVFALEDAMKILSDDELKAKTNEFKERVKNGETLDSLLPEAFAVVREASTRVTGMTPFYVQVLGGIAIHGGNIAEMKTGEGKTLTAVMPAYLNALDGKGVHIVTVNEYLAGREVNGIIGDLFRFLGLTVGLNIRDLTSDQKREVYKCDIVYSTNAELGFDYLRDHMCLYEKDMVQRPLNYAIIDEVDSILIDEARTPLIISGGQKNTANLYIQADRFAKSLQDEDYELDIEANTVALTVLGIQKAERMFGISNLYDLQYVQLVHHINNALKANYTMQKDKEYVVSDEGEVLIVDQFTGRILKGRQFNEGLHQALQAKENVKILQETITLATITYQNFFRMYAKLAGMTGTAKTEEEEFINIYNMYVIEIPTNKPVIRVDAPDYIFPTSKAKFNALVNEVKERHALGQPILIGTIAVETSEHVSKLLKKEGIKHNVLNAKQHAREADIIAEAGLKGAVTIATNMAGRGTDIKLGEGVAELGGLAVIGSERHESRRIDNQLIGRGGRQGDPGYSRFFLSAEDELLQRFGGDSFKNRIEMISRLRGEGDESPLESKIFTKFILSAQKRIEGNNFDSRKNVLKYDEVMHKQREIIYSQRTEVIKSKDVEPIANQMVEETIHFQVNPYVFKNGRDMVIDYEQICKTINGGIFNPNTITVDELKDFKTQDEIEKYLLDIVNKEIENKKSIIDLDAYKEFLKVVILRVVDTLWTKQIDEMEALRQTVTLESYGQNNPLILYQNEGYRMFENMLANLRTDVTKYIVRAQIRTNLERKEVNKPIQASSGKEELKKQPDKAIKEPGRNDPCPCGSGKKYKYCCGAK